MCNCPAHRSLVDCECQCDHTHDRLSQWKQRVHELRLEAMQYRQALTEIANEPPTVRATEAVQRMRTLARSALDGDAMGEVVGSVGMDGRWRY